jgi:hypothetical protein
MVLAYGNEDLGNRNVEDQDLAGRTGMVSCFGAAGAFFSRFVILADAFSGLNILVRQQQIEGHESHI